MSEQTISQDPMAEFRSTLQGRVILPVDPEYESARRIWNGMIDRRPAVIVQAAAITDVAPAVQYARQQHLQLAVRGGGHNVAGNSTVDGGLMLDLGALRSVNVDPSSRTVQVQPGATLADVDRATSVHHLAVPLGVVSATGVAGLTLGGGFGWLTRAHGLSIDNLLAADVVTADGGQVTASESINPELFWGLRGGGGNFGVVTSFTFQAHPLPAKVLSGNFVYYGQEHFVQALQAWEQWTRGLPEAMTSISSSMVPPPSWELGNAPALLLGFCWASDDIEEGERLIEQLRRAVPPDVEAVESVPWAEWQSAADELFPKGVRAYWKNAAFAQLTPEALNILAAKTAEQDWRGTAFDIHHMGGAMSRVAGDATPFPERGAQYWLNIYGFWNDAADDDARAGFIRGFAGEMKPFASGGQYSNFMAAEGQHPMEQALASFGRSNLERLRELKRAYDPENIFRLNHNILPAAPAVE